MAISKIIYKTSPQDAGTVWMDATPATATASDITAPKTAMLADGVLTTGTGSGGGGTTEIELVPMQSFTGDYDGTYYVADLSMGQSTYVPMPYDSISCKVVFDGDEYTVTPINDGEMVMGDYDDPIFTNYPFFLSLDPYAMEGYIVAETSGQHTVKVTYTIAGGGGGLEYEEGTWTPATDTNTEWVAFANAHTSAPTFILIVDTATSTTTANSYVSATLANYDSINVTPGIMLAVRLQYKNSSNSWAGTNAQPEYAYQVATYVTNEKFKANGSSTSYYWRAGRTYKWIAVWAPSA